jgi:hypothetical protein
MMVRRKLWLVALLVCLMTASIARAEDPFTLTAQTTSGAAGSASASSNNVVDLVGNLINTEDDFAALQNRSLSGSLRYGGVNDAVLFTRNASGSSATINIPSTGFSKTFTADNQNDLEDQIRDFFEKDGADAYADFLREINRLSTIGVTDGNPLATTAILADMGFYRFGFRTRGPGDDALRLPGGWDLKLMGGVNDSDDSDGYFAGLGLAKNFDFGERVSVVWANNFRYRNVEGADIYQVGTTLGLPISLISAKADGGLSWHVTPAFVAGFGGSWDLAAGGVLIGGQITSSLAYHHAGWTIAMGNQIGFFEGTPITWSDFRFDTNTSQQIVKNGIQVIRDLGDGGFIDVGVAYTNLLDDAAVDNYISPTVGLGLYLGESSIVRIGYQGDFADNYTAHGGNVSFLFGF